jgi:ABC-type transport system involved in cytochrome c biogenesis permease subunit
MREGAMTGTDDLRALEYAALMDRARDLERTAQWTWTGAAIACAVLLSGAISTRSAGMMLPVVVCAAFGYYANLQARRRSRLVEGYIQEFHETDRSGAQWHTRLAHLEALPGTPDLKDWTPLALSNLLTLTAIVLAWVFAEASSRGELMGGFTTMAGIAFSVHSVLESMRNAQLANATSWAQLGAPLHEVERKVASGR